MSKELSLIQEFIAESREHLRSIEEDFLQLEKQGDNPDHKLIDQIFRSVHTIKGCAGFFGMKNIGKLSHVMETLLSAMREGLKKCDRTIIDVLLEGVDMLSTMLDDTEHSNEMDITDLHSRIERVLSESPEQQPVHDFKKPVSLYDMNGNLINFEVREITLSAIPKEHHFLYLLSYDLNMLQRSKDKRPMDLIRSLRQTGEIVDGVLEPPAGDLTGPSRLDSLTYRVLYSTVMDPSLIGAAVELDIPAIIQIDLKRITQMLHTGHNRTVSAATQTTDTAELTVQEEKSSHDPDNKEHRPYEEAGAKIAETLRIRLEVLDELMMLAGELVLVRNQQLMHFDRADPLSRIITQKLDIVTSSLQESIMRTRMQPIGTVFGKFSRIVRDLGQKLGKKIEIELIGNEVELDKTILETLGDPLTHLIRNSCDHGIETPQERIKAHKPETGHITLRAFHEGGQMNIEIFDDGRGIDVDAVKKNAIEKHIKSEEEISRMGEKEIFSLIFLPGFTTVKQVTDISGRGVGMDVVKTSIEKLNGVIDIKSQKNAGTRIYLRLPLTLAIIPSLIVMSGNDRYAIPQINLEELVCLYDEQVHDRIECAGSREVYRLRNFLLPIVHLDEVLKRNTPWDENEKSEMAEQHRIKREADHMSFLNARSEGKNGGYSITFAVLKAGTTRFGLVIDKVIGTEEIVVKPMHRLLKKISIYSGSTVLGDGRVSLILDALGIARHAKIEFEEQESSITSVHERANGNYSNYLLFKSGIREQFAIDLSCIQRIERVAVNSFERVGDREFVTIDNESTNIIRLESLLEVTPSMEQDEMFLILPKRVKKPCGVLASQLIDIGSYNLLLDTLSITQPGILGSTILKGHMSLVLDMDTLLKKTDKKLMPV